MATGTATSIIGRERELHMVETMLADGEPSTCAVVLEGDAGIGKSTVWRWGVERAAEADTTVLTARPADGEERLPFAALGDLLAELGDEALDPLPARQRHALEVALQRAEPDGADGSLALARGFTALLRCAAERRPLVLAIDDVQWLDQPSAEALEFALRRLGATRLRLLLTRRSTAAAPTPFGLARAVEPTRLTEIRLQPLAIGAVHHVLRRQLGRSFPRPVLRRIHETSGGNPFYAVEIARAIERRGDGLASGEALPIPPTLEELVRERLDAVSPDAHDVLKVMAALSDATPDAVAAAGCSRAGIDEAVRDGLLELDGRTLHVTHPLLASVAYDALGPAARRSLHRRLNEVVADDDQRARHLALGTSESSEAIASELEAAAQHALARGAPDFAADLAEHAARLTPEAATGDRLRRLLFGAEQCAVAGELRRARAGARTTAARCRARAGARPALRARRRRPCRHSQDVGSGTEGGRGPPTRRDRDSADPNPPGSERQQLRRGGLGGDRVGGRGRPSRRRSCGGGGAHGRRLCSDEPRRAHPTRGARSGSRAPERRREPADPALPSWWPGADALVVGRTGDGATAPERGACSGS